MAKKKEGGGPSPSSSGKKPSDAAYKAEMRWLSNKKKRAIRHAKRMDKQITRVTRRYAAGKWMPGKTYNKVRARLGLAALA